MAEVKINNKGKVVIKMTTVQYESFLRMLDLALPSYQKNSYFTPLHKVWNITAQRIRDKFLITPYFEGKKQSITLSMEEAVIIEFSSRSYPKGAVIDHLMLELNKILS